MIPPEILQLIKKFEGFCPRAYRCPAGVWTVGYGHTAGVSPDMTVTAAEAERLLAEDLAPFLANLPPGLNANQRAALASFAFNVGLGAFNRSTLRRLVCADANDRRIADEFMRWTRAGGRVLPGLVNRRRAEARLYFSPL